MLKLILYYLLSLPLVATCQTELKTAYLDSCGCIPVYQYHPGMVFYFPDKTPVLAMREILPFNHFVYTTDGPVMTGISYSSVAGKFYEIIDVLSTNITDVNQVRHKVTTIKMKDKAATDTIYYEFPTDAFDLSKQEFEEGQRQTFSIKGAIFRDDITFAGRLKTTKAYALFPLNGRRLQQVTFKDVNFGSWETPVKITFQYMNQKRKVIDSCIELVICGTNTISSFKKSFNFNLFFTYNNPRASINIPDSIWEAITEGMPKLGMTRQWASLALGKPDITLEEETTEGKFEEYIYTKGYHLYFRNDKLVKIKK